MPNTINTLAPTLATSLKSVRSSLDLSADMVSLGNRWSLLWLDSFNAASTIGLEMRTGSFCAAMPATWDCFAPARCSTATAAGSPAFSSSAATGRARLFSLPGSTGFMYGS